MLLKTNLHLVYGIMHYLMHLGLPAVVSFAFFNKPNTNWVKIYFILIATMLVDLDHLLASPIFDPDRCSIGFHPLHSYYAIAIYIVFLSFRKTRVVSIGLLLHMLTDYIDCRLM